MYKYFIHISLLAGLIEVMNYWCVGRTNSDSGQAEIWELVVTWWAAVCFVDISEPVLFTQYGAQPMKTCLFKTDFAHVTDGVTDWCYQMMLLTGVTKWCYRLELPACKQRMRSSQLHSEPQLLFFLLFKNLLSLFCYGCRKLNKWLIKF